MKGALHSEMAPMFLAQLILDLVCLILGCYLIYKERNISFAPLCSSQFMSNP